MCDVSDEVEDLNVEVLDDPLSLTAADSDRVLPVKSIKSEPIDAELMLEEHSGADTLKENDKVDVDGVECFDGTNNTLSEGEKGIKEECGGPKKKPKRRRTMTLRKKRPSSASASSEITQDENTVLSGPKQRYFCFPAADGKQHYYCIPCGKSFPFRSYYLRHEKVHRKTRQICGYCDRQFSCKSNLDRHVRLHTGQKPYTCKDCSERFQNKSEYMKHKNTCSAFTAKSEPPKSESSLPVTAVSNSEGDSYPCYICRQTFDTIHRLQMHRKSHNEFSCRRCGKSFDGGIALSNHLRTHNFDGFRRYSCKICKKTFSNVTSLVSHKRFHTMRENAVAAASASAAAKTSGKPVTLISKQEVKNVEVSHTSGPVQGYNCTVCKKWVKTQSVLRRHMTSHTKLKLYSCVICNMSMGYASSLHKHMRLTHNVEVSYKDIRAMFSVPALEEQEALCMLEEVSKASVEKNKRPGGEKDGLVTIYDSDDDIDGAECIVKYGCTCSICFKAFSNKRLLENHMKIIHMGGRAYKCNICSKLFAYKHLLVKHAKIHSGKNHEYSCSVCSRTFPDMKTLNNHKGVHTRFKYYTCPICSKSFNGFKNWEQHQKLHNSSIRFKCKLCGKTFLSKTDLFEHKKMHIKLKIYTCGVCKNSYNSMATLNRHKLKKHGNASGMNPYDEDSEGDIDEEDQCFICNVCNKTFTDSASLSKHKLIHMKRDFGNVEEMSDTSLTVKASNNTGSIKPPGKFWCVLCQRDFPDQSSLSKHKGWHSRTPLESELSLPLKGKKVYVCGYCNRSFANSGSLSKHRKLNCPPKRNYFKNLVPTALIPGKSVFSVKSALHSRKTASHVKQIILSGKPKVSSYANAPKIERARHFPCLMCEKIFSTKKALIRHKGWHTRCRIQGRKQPPPVDSPSEDAERNVIEEQVVSKRRTCNVCFKVYSSASTLSRHKRLHTRKILTNIKSIKKPLPVISNTNEEADREGFHACQYCEKLFRSRKHVVDHERVHTGERPFSCNQCSLSFSRRAILWRHKKTHLGYRPYSCTFCPKSFLMNFQLNQHIAEKHMPKDTYDCHRCDKTYRTMLALRKHEQMVHEVYEIT